MLIAPPLRSAFHLAPRQAPPYASTTLYRRAVLNLERLDFGALAAERDKGLQDYFIESESYRRILDGDRSVILGNRGSGKTAIFKMVAEAERSRGARVVELAPEDYSYELLNQTMEAQSRGSWAKQGAYAAAWKYLIYVLTMKEVTRGGKGFKTGPARRIYEYLRDEHAELALNPVATLISYLKRLEGVKLGKYEAGLKSKALHQLYKLEELEPLLDDLDAVCEKTRVVLLVDELDRGWDASEDAVSFVAGLFSAAIAVSRRTPNVRVLISLRRELYENIPALYEDAQKVRDIIEVVEWNEPELRQLISKRIEHSLGGTDAASPEDYWNAVFAETIDYRLNKSFNYIVDRTLYRPREIIQFCTDIRRIALDENVSPPLNYDVISHAELGYSDARLKDIAAEYRFQYPGLLSVFETFRGMTYNLERDELEFHVLQVTEGDLPVDADATPWCTNLEIDAMIEILWRVGFIRAKAVGGLKARRRSGSQYLGSHQVSALNLSSISAFHVHPMFRSYLGLREKKGTRGQ